MPEHAQPVRVEVSWDGATATVTLTGELDIASADGVAERLIKAVEARPGRLVLDLGGLVFADVAGGRALDHAHRSAVEAGCPVVIRLPRPSGRGVVRLVGFMGG